MNAGGYNKAICWRRGIHLKGVNSNKIVDSSIRRMMMSRMKKEKKEEPETSNRPKL